MTRILIAGGPRTGKTTLATAMSTASGALLRHTDHLIGAFDWSSASALVAMWLDDPGPWIVEGVAVPRALRKWIAAHPDDTKPCDVVYWLTAPWAVQSPGQLTMAKGCATVWSEVAGDLARRGVDIRTAAP